MTDEQLLSFQDLKELYQKQRKKLWKIALYVALSVLALFGFKAPQYKAQAAFKQASAKASPSLLLQNLFKEGELMDSESTAIPLMKSRRLMRRVVEEMGLQASLSSQTLFHRYLLALARNLKAEAGLDLDNLDGFRFKNVSYTGERKQSYALHFFNPSAFEVFNAKKEVVAQGHLNEEVALPELRFTLIKTPEKLSFTKRYSLTLKPWLHVVDRLIAQIFIAPHKTDRKVLLLNYRNPDRYLAAELLNQIMESYKACLQEDNEQIATDQLAYLERRQEELTARLDHLLDEHAGYLKQNLGSEGFVSLAQQVEILSVPKQQYVARLFDIDLNLERQKEKIPYHTELARFESRLLNIGLEEQKHPSKQEQASHFSEFDGLDLEMAQKLTLEYMHQLDEMQAYQRQLVFVRDQMQKPEFEISSLSEVLKDPISQSLIAHASDLSLKLSDMHNWTQKDHERLKEDLETQKKFIGHHLEETRVLNRIQAKLIQEKIAALQKLTIDLLKTERKLIEGKLSDIRGRLLNLPDQWRLENQFKLKTELMKEVMEGVTQMVESKHVDLHMHQIASKSLDSAYPPLEPEAPYLLLYTAIAAFLASSSAFLYHLWKANPSLL